MQTQPTTAADPLYQEHRLIERMVGLMNRTVTRIKDTGRADLSALGQIIDFLRFYADRCHHGKEEDVLFQALAGKTLEPRHMELMEQLIKEHQLGRHNVHKLDEACRAYEKGDQDALEEITANLEILATFYPKHIDKEDNRFFPDGLLYLTDREQKALLRLYAEFDRQLIHEKYERMVTALEKGER